VLVQSLSLVITIWLSFSFEEFVALMTEDEGSIAELGRSVSRWQGKQVDNDKRKSFKLIKANISRLGLKAAVEKEDARLKKEEVKLQKIGGAGASGYQLPGANKPRQQVSLSPSPLSPSPLSPTSTSPFTDRSMFVDTSRLQSDPHNPLVPASSLLTPLELIRYRTVFNMLDVDQDGSVTCQEMMQSTRTVTGRQPAEVEIREFMDLTDTNGNGSMEFDEFVVVMQRTKRALGRMGTPRTEFTMTSEQRKREKYKQVFDSFDLNRDGRISPDELKQKLQSMGKTVDDGNCRTLFSTYDLNRDGVLDFEEFIPMMDALVARELSL
jgi:calmodulin